MDDVSRRLWSILAATEGTVGVGKFSFQMVSIANLEFRVHLDKGKMYPQRTHYNIFSENGHSV